MQCFKKNILKTLRACSSRQFDRFSVSLQVLHPGESQTVRFDFSASDMKLFCSGRALVKLMRLYRDSTPFDITILRHGLSLRWMGGLPAFGISENLRSSVVVATAADAQAPEARMQQPK